MMEWALAILFGAAIVLLILSFSISNKKSKEQEEENNAYYATIMKELKDLQDKTRDIELDIEIIAQEAGMKLSPEERVKLREAVDMHRRKYSTESIAKKIELSESEVKRMLAPYVKPKVVRGEVTNDS
ncbi:hypothetical protein [Bacillus sp. 1P06AnD]|uniref:hypothetical protein n=1 Tax=Bacillus sp. 1P06AnD TaxID=3132208 RepID=UPI00399EF0FD